LYILVKSLLHEGVFMWYEILISNSRKLDLL